MIEIIASLTLVAVVGNSILLWALFKRHPVARPQALGPAPSSRPSKAFPKKDNGRRAPRVNDDLAAWRMENNEPAERD